MSAVCAVIAATASVQRARTIRSCMLILAWAWFPPSRAGLKSRPYVRGCLLRCRRGARWLQVLVEPIQVALQAIAFVAWDRQAVDLAGIDHQLSVDAETLERLIH